MDRATTPDGCHLWTGAVNSKGYGRLYVHEVRGPRLAHRWAWEHHHGPIPPGLYVLHTCDNPPCQNQDHHYLGTAKQNTEDAMARGRLVPPPLRTGTRTWVPRHVEP